jgi:hypothetical protein
MTIAERALETGEWLLVVTISVCPDFERRPAKISERKDGGKA